MSTEGASDPPYADADYYGFFMTGLFGLIDDAELAGYSPYGIELLREARELFWAEFKETHPAAWEPEGS